MNRIDLLLYAARKKIKPKKHIIFIFSEYNDGGRMCRKKGFRWDGIEGSGQENFCIEENHEKEAEKKVEKLIDLYPGAEVVIVSMDYGQDQTEKRGEK